MYWLTKEQLPLLVKKLAEEYKIFGPRHDRVSGEVIFDHLPDWAELDLQAAIPYNPPKFILFPHYEEILKYRYQPETKEVRIEQINLLEPKALIGLRSCDLTGLLCLDRFFLGQEYVDEFYLAHRKSCSLSPIPVCVRFLSVSASVRIAGRRLKRVLIWI